MLHDVVLPGARLEGEPCPECKRELPWQAGGSSTGPLQAIKPSVSAAHKDALEGKPETLLNHLDPNRYAVQHNPVWREGQQQPCRFSEYPSWLLAHCRKPKDVDDWVTELNKLDLNGLWKPPEASNGS